MARPSAEEAQTSVRFRASFAGVTRRLRGVEVAGDDIAALTDAGVIGAADWRIDRVARVALLSQVLVAVSFEEHAAFVRQVYLRGDYKEQAAVLASLSFLPGPERYLDLAIDACRTNVLDVFEGIAPGRPDPGAGGGAWPRAAGPRRLPGLCHRRSSDRPHPRPRARPPGGGQGLDRGAGWRRGGAGRGRQAGLRPGPPPIRRSGGDRGCGPLVHLLLFPRRRQGARLRPHGGNSPQTGL